MNKNLINIILFILLIPLFIDFSAKAESNDNDLRSNLKELYKGIRTTEKTVSNIKVDSQCWLENWDPNTNKWVRNSKRFTSCTAWFNGLPKSKTRIDVHKEIIPWKNGTAPYAEDVYSIGFDGKSARRVLHKSGAIDNTFDMKEAYITSKPDNIIYSNSTNIATGARFSTVLYNNDSGVLMSKQFNIPESAKLKDGHIECKREMFEGVECIKVGSGYVPKIGEQSFWFDPARGYALLGAKHTNILKDGKVWLIKSIKVEKFKEVSEGIWWPTKATLESEDPKTHELYRSVYQASSVVINDPNFNEKVFTVEIPSGYHVKDQVKNISYKSDGLPNKLK